eukprot:TRINITY_DN16126_c0_g1_i1.p2 TRINITY_DN16126_c0_g1~~TRINITY_DN16126_c0_g1_i1.p2  ORF type:complete len:121 (+),score=15.47 TRINITY_DN16126_c0_g1_i1:421-783(+)
MAAGSQVVYMCNEACKGESNFESLLSTAGLGEIRGEEENWVNKRTFSSVLLSAMTEASIPAAALIAICYEGDNTPDAFMMARTLSSPLELGEDIEWKPPPSWTHIRGAPLPRELVASGLF